MIHRVTRFKIHLAAMALCFAALLFSANASALGETPAANPAWQQSHPADASQTRWVPGKGIEFTSTDKMFRLQLRPRAQFLYEFMDAQGADEARDRSQAVLVRRARLATSGYMWGDDVAFKLELALSPKDLGMTDHKSGNPPITNKDNTPTRSPMLDFYVDFKQIRDLNLRVGQYKVQYSRQRAVSSGNMMFVDRTIANGEFNIDRDIGLTLGSTDLFGMDKKLRYYLSVTSGEGHSSSAANDFGMMYVGRVEVLPLGNFKDFDESDLGRQAKPRLSLGLGFAYLENGAGNKGIIGKRPADGGVTDTKNLTADLMFKMAGLSVQAEFYWRDGSRQAGDALDGAIDDDGKPVAAEKARNGTGVMAQAGYLLAGVPLEFAGRYAMIRGAGDDSSLGDGNEVGGAVNYYFAGHPMKLQADVIRVWSDDFGKGDNQARLQLQVAF